MPFRLRKAPKKDAYWVVDDTGKKYSKSPMPMEAARRQQKALYAAEGRGELRGRGDDEDDDELSRLFATKVSMAEEAPRPTNPTARATTTYVPILPRKRKHAEMMRGRPPTPPPPPFMEPAPQKAMSSRKKGRGVTIGRPQTAAAPPPVASPPPPPPQQRRPVRRRESIERLRPEAQVRLAMRELVPAPIADEIVRFADPENRVELARIRRRMEELDALVPRNQRGEPFVGPEHREIAMELMNLARRRRQLEGRGMAATEDAFAYFGE